MAVWSDRQGRPRAVLSAALLVSLAYLAFGVSWILLSDRGVVRLTQQGLIDDPNSAQTVKGIVYVVLSTVLVGVLVTVALRAVGFQERRFRAAVEAAGAGMLERIYSEDREICSPQTLRMLGFDPDEVDDPSAFLRERMHPEDRSNIDDTLCVAEETEWIGAATRVRILDGDGQWRHLLVRGRVVQRSRDGSPERLLAVLLDMTEQRSLERQIRQYQKLEALGTLASGVAHDFNNILGSAQGNARLLRRRLQDPEALELLTEVDRAHDRGAALVGQIREFARVGPARAESVELPGVVTEVLELLRPIRPPNVKVVMDVDPSCPAVRANAGQLHRITMNLCTNAVRSMEGTGGVLTVGIAPIEVGDHHAVRMMVRDTGRGMDEETRRRIFDPYFTTHEGSSGLGLGLAMVHGMVEAFHGRIDVESEVGAGTTFTIILPADARESPELEEQRA